MEVTIGLAFAAGFISFISPCVLPLVPAYITYMGGRVTKTVAATAGGGQIVQNGALTRLNTVIHSVFFVLGFSLVFVGIGLLSTAFIQQVGGSNVRAITNIIGRAGGVVIIVFGIHFMDGISWSFNKIRPNKDKINALASALILLVGGIIIFWAFDRPPSAFAANSTPLYRLIISLPVFTAFALWLFLGGAFTRPAEFWLNVMNRIEYALYADTRQQMQQTQGGNGFGSSTLMGIVFAAGWTPCIGPIYGAILTLAANGGSVSQAGSMLAAYSLGLGIPFMVTALLLDGAQGMLRSLNRHMRMIKLISGGFLIAVGVLVASGQLQRISALGANGELGEISFRMEECFTHAVVGDIPWGKVTACVNGEYSIDGTATDEEFSMDELPTLGTDAGEEGNALELDLSPLTDEASTTDDANTTTDEDDSADIVPLTIEQAAANDAVETAEATGLNVGDLAPDFSSFTPHGEAVRLSDYRGQTVLINFWATWCGPCRVEMPEFEDALKDFGGFTILAVNNRETAEQVQGFADDLSLTFPMVMDIRGEIQDLYEVEFYPTTFLINAEGTIVERRFGALNAGDIGEMLIEYAS